MARMRLQPSPPKLPSLNKKPGRPGVFFRRMPTRALCISLNDPAAKLHTKGEAASGLQRESFEEFFHA